MSSSSDSTPVVSPELCETWPMPLHPVWSCW